MPGVTTLAKQVAPQVYERGFENVRICVYVNICKRLEVEATRMETMKNYLPYSLRFSRLPGPSIIALQHKVPIHVVRLTRPIEKDSGTHASERS